MLSGVTYVRVTSFRLYKPKCFAVYSKVYDQSSKNVVPTFAYRQKECQEYKTDNINLWKISFSLSILL